MRHHLAPSEMFKRTNELVAGVWTRLHHIECSDCPTSEALRDGTHGWLAPQIVIEKFRQKGWDVGKGRDRDLCPACVMNRRLAAAGPVTLHSLADLATLPLIPRVEVALEPVIPPYRTPRHNQSRPRGERRRGATDPVYPPKLPGALRRQPIFTANFYSLQGARAAARTYLRRWGLDEAKGGVHYELIKHTNGRWGWRTLAAAQPRAPAVPAPAVTEPAPLKEEPTMSPTPTLTVVESEPAMTAEAPRESTPADRRRILDTINDLYDVGRQCWKGALSDKKLAADMDVPRAWIERIRDEFYGPDVNEDGLRVKDAATKLIERMEALEERALALASEAEAMKREWRDLVA